MVHLWLPIITTANNTVIGRVAGTVQRKVMQYFRFQLILKPAWLAILHSADMRLGTDLARPAHYRYFIFVFYQPLRSAKRR